jgi:hypothetical protein
MLPALSVAAMNMMKYNLGINHLGYCGHLGTEAIRAH